VNSLPPSRFTDTLQAKIDGGNWAAQSISTQLLSGQLAMTGSLINGTQMVGLIMPTNIGIGTYRLDFTGGTYIGLYNPTPNIALASSAGTLTILSNNVRTQRIRGNFQFQTTDPLGGLPAPHSLTNGFFSVYYGP
jgi:hypothetical protein